jgi:glyoxylase-like metal-dependent hydrolase (beta-lactamase superfamily II)
MKAWTDRDAITSQARSAVVMALAAICALAFAGCGRDAAPSDDDGLPAVETRLHTYVSSAAALLANAYVLETVSGLIVIDATLTVSDARKLRSLVDSLAKPLRAVFVTHGHPDHYNGLTELVAGLPTVPIYATEGVDRVIREWDARKEQQWRGTFGAEWPTVRTFPTRVVPGGTTVTIDGVRLTAHDLGPGESHHDAYWTAAGSEAYAFVGDLVFSGEHAYVSDGHTARWMRTLEELRSTFAEARLLPGHGPPGGVELLTEQLAYLQEYRSEVSRLAQGRTRLSDAQEAELTERMSAFRPSATLTFLIGIGADAVAAELAAEASARP